MTVQNLKRMLICKLTNLRVNADGLKGSGHPQIEESYQKALVKIDACQSFLDACNDNTVMLNLL
jgi:hypothetical protein